MSKRKKSGPTLPDVMPVIMAVLILLSLVASMAGTRVAQLETEGFLKSVKGYCDQVLAEQKHERKVPK